VTLHFSSPNRHEAEFEQDALQPSQGSADGDLPEATMAGRFSSSLKHLRVVGNYAVISRCIGVLLLTAAGLKLWGLRVDAVPSLGVLSSPEFKVGLIEFEVFLGVWLLSGKATVVAWFTAILTFVAFAAASGYQGWQGQASCGCLGRLSQYMKP
jgi:hypothetical protein